MVVTDVFDIERIAERFSPRQAVNVAEGVNRVVRQTPAPSVPLIVHEWDWSTWHDRMMVIGWAGVVASCAFVPSWLLAFAIL